MRIRLQLAIYFLLTDQFAAKHPQGGGSLSKDVFRRRLESCGAREIESTSWVTRIS